MATTNKTKQEIFEQFSNDLDNSEVLHVKRRLRNNKVLWVFEMTFSSDKIQYWTSDAANKKKIN